MENPAGVRTEPYSAVQIANEFIVRGAEDGIRDMTNMKIQKLVYFAHGFFLAKHGEPLIREDFVVWKHGPVVRQLYEKFKEDIARQGWNSKHSFDEPLNDQENDVFRIRKDDRAAICVINSVWRACKEYRASYLSRLTHSFDSPWTITLEKQGPKARIPDSVIASYFQNL